MAIKVIAQRRDEDGNVLKRVTSGDNGGTVPPGSDAPEDE
jgi:hypothetical protein